MSTEEKKLYTLSVFSENRIGLLNRITIIFTRRNLNIESITASESEVPSIYRYTIMVKCSQEQVQKLVMQVEKLVEVVKAFVHEEQDVVYQELALYKVPVVMAEPGLFESIVRRHHARILSVERDFIVLEKTGHREEVELLFKELEAFNVLEYACSGRVAVTKPMKELSSYLKELNFYTNE